MGSGVSFYSCEGELDWAVCMTRKGNMSNYKIQKTYRLLPQTPKKLLMYINNYFFLTQKFFGSQIKQLKII